MRGLQERLNLTVVGSPRVYASDILGNVALESELTIARLDAEGAEVILTYKQGANGGHSAQPACDHVKRAEGCAG